MIGKLTGIVEILSKDSLIIDVLGVGYFVFASTNTINILEKAEKVTLHIETYVREDVINLYGFATFEEKDCFNKLMQVSGVGTKVALAILSAMKPHEVVGAILSKNKSAFSSVSGIGTKLAERILLELKDKNFKGQEAIFSKPEHLDLINDSISALINLGISKNDASQTVNKIIRENKLLTIDEIIRMALSK
ncbi:MAG: Holliday junction branch migration protein RuvA [Rickettsiaceae bacterium]|nr:Holliday junction branch migration protein RuvA [Rickettsiaceae bacterium]